MNHSVPPAIHNALSALAQQDQRIAGQISEMCGVMKDLLDKCHSLEQGQTDLELRLRALENPEVRLD